MIQKHDELQLLPTTFLLNLGGVFWTTKQNESQVKKKKEEFVFNLLTQTK